MRLFLLMLLLALVACATETTMDDVTSDPTVKKVADKKKKEEIETFFEIDGKLKKISSSLLKSNLTSANEYANEAVAALRKRRSKLRARRSKCGMLESVEKRRVCFTYLQEELKLLRDEKALVGDLAKCNGVAMGKVERLVACVTEVKRRHALLSPDGVKVPSEKGVGKRKIKALVMAVSGEDPMAEREVEEAVREIREKLESIAGQWSMCATLATKAMRIGCRKGIAQMRDENRRERQLLKKLERCGEIYAFEDKARERCSHLIGRKLYNYMLNKAHRATSTRVIVPKKTKSPIKDLAPSNMQQLKAEQKTASKKIRDRIASILSAMDQCNGSLKCKVPLHKMLIRARRDLDLLGVRYKPRRECLEERARFQKREFEIRAKEHAALLRLHSQASACETPRCLAKYERLELALNKVLGKRRADRHAEWLKIKCYFVLPYDLVAPEKFTYKTLASLHFNVHELYTKLNKCKTKKCKENRKFELRLLKGQIKRLTTYLKKKHFVSSIRRHKDRAKLHQQLATLYRKALTCHAQECRRHARIMLNHLSHKLAEKQFDWRVGTKHDDLDFHTGDVADEVDDE